RLPLAGAAHKPMPVQHGMHSRLCRNAHIPGKPAHQQLADLPGTPVRFVPLRLHDQPLDLRRQLVGIADWAPRAVAKRVHSLLPVPVPDLVAGLAGDAEFPAHPAHAVALQKTADKTNSLVHNRTLLPRHQHLPKSEKCYLCVRYKTSPISRVVHPWFAFKEELQSAFSRAESLAHASVLAHRSTESVLGVEQLPPLHPPSPRVPPLHDGGDARVIRLVGDC